jgi:hypothetical protein
MPEMQQTMVSLDAEHRDQEISKACVLETQRQTSNTCVRLISVA